MQIKIGILSAALISNDFVLSLKNLDPSHYKVVAIGATSLESAQGFALQHNIPKAYGSYKELAEDPEVQLVYIANRNMYHYAAAKLCIEHKKHVLVEKPFTIDPETTKELFELGQKHNVFVMEALWSRFLPAWQKVREIIDSGEIGDIVHIGAQVVTSNYNDRICLSKFGGGVAADMGTYGLNAIFEGVNYTRPINVKAFGRLSKPGESETSVSAILDFPGEVTATLILTARLGTRKYLDKLQQIVYFGTKGYLKINDYLNCPKSLEVNGKVISTNVKDNQTNYNWPNSYGLCYQVEEVRKCIMNNQLTSPLHGPEKTLLLTETIRKIVKEIGVEVIETPRDYDFKNV